MYERRGPASDLPRASRQANAGRAFMFKVLAVVLAGALFAFAVWRFSRVVP